MVQLKAEFGKGVENRSNWHLQENYFLNPRFYARNFGVLPVVTLVFLDCCWMTFCTIKGFQRTDVVLSRHGIKSKEQGELTELLLHPVNRKFLKFSQVYTPQPELYAAYEEMKKAQENC